MKIGIDFGTSFSLPAGMINGNPAVLLPGGEYGIPSVFYYDSDVGVQIGQPALDCEEVNPANVKREIKMEISEHGDSFAPDGRKFTKKQIVGHLFREIARVAQDELERRQLASQELEGAVISVPAAFTLRELNFIRDAAQSAGLRVLGFIREPVAAAISYFNAPSAEDQKTILVYDLGGGTCDVAIVRSDHNSDEWYSVIESDMQRIGGRDWDKLLVELIKRKCREKNPHIKFDEEAEAKLRSAAVDIKHNLSKLESTLKGFMIGGKRCNCMITRADFERATAELLQSTMTMVEKLKYRCGAKIDYIVCVGGSSNMPQVPAEFKRRYPDIPIKIFEPEKAIAFGAAIYAQHLTNAQFLQDICKFSYGARYLENVDSEQYKVWNMIFKDDPLPTSNESESYLVNDGDSFIYIPIFESECVDDVYDPVKGTYIGEIQMRGLADGRRGDLVTLTMAIDTSGLMQLKAVHVRTGKTVNVELQLKDY